MHWESEAVLRLSNYYSKLPRFFGLKYFRALSDILVDMESRACSMSGVIMSLNTKFALTWSLVLSTLACSNSNFGRTVSSDADASGEKPFTASSDDGASRPEVVSGAYLVEVSAVCVFNTSHSCRAVGLSAAVKTSAEAKAILVSESTAITLAVRSISWDFQGEFKLICNAGKGFEFSPVCTSADGSSLANTIIKAQVTLVFNDGGKKVSDAPNAFPVLGGEPKPTATPLAAVGESTHCDTGRFKHVDPRDGYRPSGLTYIFHSTAFTEICMDEISGLYFTNILYDPLAGATVGIDWDKADLLCRLINSGDGAGKWRLPSIVDLCGSPNGVCNGGLQGAGIKDIHYGTWDWRKPVWVSALPEAVAAWYVYLFDGSSDSGYKSRFQMGAFCVRD